MQKLRNMLLGMVLGVMLSWGVYGVATWKAAPPLSPERLAAMPVAEIPTLTPEQILEFGPRQLTAFSDEQLLAFSEPQRMAYSRAIGIRLGVVTEYVPEERP